MKCDETITYTTHCDLKFLDNVIPLLQRWEAPLSVAVWVPWNYFELTLKSISYLRNCHAKSLLVRRFATFHIFFESEDFPKIIPKAFVEFEKKFKCQENVIVFKTSFDKQNRTYPINVGRNLAREAALTHFVLASDIELYPSPGLVDGFFKMLKSHSGELLTKKKYPTRKSFDFYQSKMNSFLILVFSFSQSSKLSVTRKFLETNRKLLSCFKRVWPSGFITSSVRPAIKSQKLVSGSRLVMNGKCEYLRR